MLGYDYKCDYSVIATLQPSAEPCRVPCENLDEEGPAAVVIINSTAAAGAWALIQTQSLYEVPSAGEMVWINRISKPFFVVRDQIQHFGSRLTLDSYRLLNGNGYFGLFPVAAD